MSLFYEHLLSGFLINPDYTLRAIQLSVLALCFCRPQSVGENAVFFRKLLSGINMLSLNLHYTHSFACLCTIQAQQIGAGAQINGRNLQHR